MPKFIVPVKFTFSGTFTIIAETKQEAISNVTKHCGLVIGGDIHSSLPSENIDWDFNVHPTKRLGIAKKLPGKMKSKPFLWGKKFCHPPSESHPIHISDKNTTLCGRSMLGNNYADQTNDKATCKTCIDKYEASEGNDIFDKQLKHE